MAKKKQSQQAPDVIEIMSSDEEPPVSSKKIQKAAASIKTNVKNAGASATNQFTKKSGRQRSTALVGVSGDTGAGPSRLSSIASGSSDQTNYPASRNGIDTLTPKRLRLDTGSSTTNPVLKKPRTNDNIEAVSANSDGEAHSAPDDLKAYLKSLRDAGLEGTDALGIEYPEFDDEILRLIDLVGDSKACLAAYAKERADFVDRFLHRILDGTDLEDAKAANHFPFLTSRAKVQLFGYNQPRAGEKMFTINQNGDWERSSHWSSISCHEMWFDQIDINGHSIQRLRAAFLACLRLPPCAHLGKAIDRARATGLDYVPLAWLSEGVAFDGTCFGIYSLLPPAKGIALADAVRARTEAGIMPQRPHPPPPPPSATPKTSQGGYAGMTIVDMEYRRGGHDYKAVNQLCEAVRAEYPFHKWEMGQVFGFPQSQRPEIPTEFIRLIEMFVILLTRSTEPGNLNRNCADNAHSEGCPAALILLFVILRIRDIQCALEANPSMPGLAKVPPQNSVEWDKYSAVVEHRVSPATLGKYFYGADRRAKRLIQEAGIQIPDAAWGGKERTPINWLPERKHSDQDDELGQKPAARKTRKPRTEESAARAKELKMTRPYADKQAQVLAAITEDPRNWFASHIGTRKKLPELPPSDD